MRTAFRIYRSVRTLQNLIASALWPAYSKNASAGILRNTFWVGAISNLFPEVGQMEGLPVLVHKDADLSSSLHFCLVTTHKSPGDHHLQFWKAKEFGSANLLVVWLCVWVRMCWLTGPKGTKRWNGKPLKGSTFFSFQKFTKTVIAGKCSDAHKRQNHSALCQSNFSSKILLQQPQNINVSTAGGAGETKPSQLSVLLKASVLPNENFKMLSA